VVAKISCNRTRLRAELVSIGRWATGEFRMAFDTTTDYLGALTALAALQNMSNKFNSALAMDFHGPQGAVGNKLGWQ
jgi:hypothetical protein